MQNLTQHAAPAVYVNQAYLSYDDDVPLFSDLNFTLVAGKTTCLLGPSGVGKSTLLRLLAGLIHNNKNSKVSYKASVTSSLKSFCINENIAYMSQTDLLLPWLSVLENVLLSSRLRSTSKINKKILMENAIHLLKQLGLGDALKLFPNQLSGGMRQRVALARTIIDDKPIILMDEPFSALDSITRYNMQTLITEFLKNKTVLLITHDPLEALRIGDVIYMIKGKPASLYKVFELHSPKPRCITDNDILGLQAKLMLKLATDINS